jgi:hypothetical protein
MSISGAKRLIGTPSTSVSKTQKTGTGTGTGGITLSFRRVREIAKGDYQLRHFCLSVRMEQLGSHWTDFHEILRLGILRKSVENIQVSLNPKKNNRYFT